MPKNSTQLFVRPTLLALAAAACVSAIAQENTQTMSEVVVTASGFEQELKQAPASITVVTREDIEKKSTLNFGDLIHGVAGVDARGGQGKTGGLSISMRGMPSSFTLILVDGQRINPAGDVTPNGFSDAHNNLIPPVSAIERIEIVRGPMSTLYGSDAMGGVINIITKKIAHKWNGSVGIEGSFPQTHGEGKQQKTNFYLNGPIKNDVLGIALRGGWSHRDGYSRQALGIPSNTTGHTPTKSDVYSFGTRLTLTPSKEQQFWLDVDMQRSNYDNRGGDLGGLDIPNGNARGYGPELKFNRDKAVFGYEEKTPLGLVSASLSHLNTKTVGRTLPTDALALGQLNRPELAGTPRLLEATSTYLDAKIVSPIGEKHILNTGLQIANEEARDGLAQISGNNKFTKKTWAMFAEDEWFLKENLALTTGLRYDHHDKFGGNFSPRAYLVWNTTESLTLKGGISRGFKAPNLNYLTSGIAGYSGQGTTQVIGNPALKPETSTSTEISALYDSQNGWNGSFTVFHNEIKNKIESQPCTGTNTPLPGCRLGNANYYENLDKGKTYGAEFSSNWSLRHGVNIKTSYTWTESQSIKNGLKNGRLGDTAKHLLLANFNWTINQQWNTWLQAEYRAGARRVSDVSKENEMFDPYSLFHLGFSYNATKNINLGMTINNLFNRNFRAKNSNGDFKYFTHGGGGNARSTSQDGRTIWVRTTINF